MIYTDAQIEITRIYYINFPESFASFIFSLKLALLRAFNAALITSFHIESNLFAYFDYIS